MKIAIITGSYPPDACGVGDYTYVLANKLKQQGISVTVIKQNRWTGREIKKLIKELKNYDVVHLQYPTQGYGYSLGPHLLSILRPLVITIHEVSQAHIIRRFSLLAFTLRPIKLIFTTEFEKNYAEKHAPWIKGRTTFIPIGSNIPIGKRAGEIEKQVVYFGLIYPKKNIEDFIKLTELAHNSGLQIKFKIIGKVVDKFQSYYSELKEKSKNLPVEWLINLNDTEVANILSQTTFAYLPFPDGASDRRSSLLATLSNGVITITTRGLFTPKSMEKVVKFANTPLDALQIIKSLIGREECLQILSRRSEEYAERFSWEHIAMEHIEIYEEIAGGHK
jgi:glycosyltransferase involved in cell wall biosynthesis